jgi:hypothetical protein
MAGLPNTHQSLVAAGYTFSSKGQCRKCPALIQWYTTPAKKWMPFDMPNADGEFENHWATCPAREAFKKKKK